MRTPKPQRDAPGDARLSGARPLSAQLSQVLVAFTIELDNEFERRMNAAGFPGALLSLVVWSNLMRFLSEAGVPVRTLASQALASEKRIKPELGCLERWGFVVLKPDSPHDRPAAMRPHGRSGAMRREGWGSGREIRSGWLVRPTEKGRKAMEIWAPLPLEIEKRWQTRFGNGQIANLRQALEGIAGQLDIELPQGLPGYWDAAETYPAGGAQPTEPIPLPALLSQLLLAFTIEFDRESRVPLRLCANAIRVLDERPIPLSDLPCLTGGSRETSDIGWQVKPFVAVEPDPAATRGKLVRLTPLGLKVQQKYRKLIREIEERWEARFGEEKIRRLRESLQGLFVPRSGDRLLLAQGLVPPEGTMRAGVQAPALGRRDVAAAARQRMRDMVAQTARFLSDPAGTLPHYPQWDINRGFGP